MADATLAVRGYRDFLRACDRAGRETKRTVRGTFREVGEIVRVDAAARFADRHAKTAAGYRTVVRVRGVTVEQTLRRTTGRHPEFAALQMREALVPAADAKQGEVEDAFAEAIDRVADHFDDS